MKRTVLPLLLSALFVAATDAQTTRYSVLCNVVGDGAGKSDRTPIRVEVNGRKVTRFKSEFNEHSRRIIFVNDTSGSMQQKSTEKLGAEVIRTFARAASDDEQLGLINFNEKISLDIDLTNPKSFAAAFENPDLLKKRKGHGRTDLYDAVLFAAARLQNIAPHRQEGDAIVVLSDGFEDGSHATRKQMVNKMRASGIRTYIFQFVPGQYPAGNYGLQSEGIYDVVDDSGGMVLAAYSKNKSLNERWSMQLEPDYDTSSVALEAVRKNVALLHTYIDQANRFSFDLDAPITSPTKVKFTAPGNEKTVGLFCPKYLAPD